jgi:hypothetical protein
MWKTQRVRQIRPGPIPSRYLSMQKIPDTARIDATYRVDTEGEDPVQTICGRLAICFLYCGKASTVWVTIVPHPFSEQRHPRGNALFPYASIDGRYQSRTPLRLHPGRTLGEDDYCSITSRS